jgi:hypothetical protein
VAAKWRGMMIEGKEENKREYGEGEKAEMNIERGKET